MACKAPAIWVSLILIFVGLAIAVLACLPWFLVPNAIEDTVTESAVMTGEKDDGFKEFKDQTKNPLVYSCYFWNITNPVQVRGGAKPALQAVGPYVWKKYAHRINITFSDDKNTFYYKEWNEYIYDTELSVAGGNKDTDKVWTINTAWVAGLPGRGLDESKIGASITQSALASLNNGLKTITLPLKFFNAAWPLIFAGAFSTGLGNSFAALAVMYQTEEPTWPLPDETGTLAAISIENPDAFNQLFNSSVPGSLANPSTTDFWLPGPTCATNPIFAAIGLNISQITPLCSWRSLFRNATHFKRLSDVGGPAYYAVLGGIAGNPAGPLNDFLPANFNPADESTVIGMETNIGYIHFGMRTETTAGLFNGFSLVDLDPATAAQLANTKPELGIFIASRGAQVSAVEFTVNPPDSANLEVLLAPAPLTAVESRWLFSTFGGTTSIGGTPIGATATGVFVATLPTILGITFQALWANRDFAGIEAAWNAAAWPTIFNATLTAIAPAAGLPSNIGTLLQTFGLFSNSVPLSFQKVFQIYLMLKYNYIGTLAPNQLSGPLNSGLIIKVSPQETMFGRTEAFFSAAQGTVISVPGIWSDYTIELGIQNNFIETYLTGNDDVKNYRSQLTYNGNSSLQRYFPTLSPSPVVTGSSLTFIGPYRLISKSGIKKAEDSKFLLWVSDVVRDLELIYQKETELLGINLYRFKANADYKTVVKSSAYRNPYDFVMDNSIKYAGGAFPFYLTFPGFTLVKETDLFNARVDGVNQDPENWILTWDFEPITGLAMRASAPLQLSFPLGTTSFKQVFNAYSLNVANATVPAWYIVRSNQISNSQADDWKQKVGGAIGVQVGLTIAMAVIGGVLFVVGVALLIWKLVAGKSGEMTEFELRN